MDLLRFLALLLLFMLPGGSVSALAAEGETDVAPPDHFDEWIMEGGSDTSVFDFARHILLSEPLVIDAAWLAQRNGSPDLHGQLEGDLLIEANLGSVHITRDLNVAGDLLVGPGTTLQVEASLAVSGNLIAVDDMFVEDSLSVGAALSIAGGGLFVGRGLSCVRSIRIGHTLECDGDVQADNMFLGDRLLVKGQLQARSVDARGEVSVNGGIDCSEIVGAAIFCGGNLAASEFVHAMRGSLFVGGDLSCLSASAGYSIEVRGAIDCAVALAAGCNPVCLPAGEEQNATVSCRELRSGNVLLGKLVLVEEEKKTNQD